MITEFSKATTITNDKVRRDDKTNRRMRHIVANSGLEMESGEVRDLNILNVMGTDGKLYNVNDLPKPEKQDIRYTVQLATNHGHVDEATGELTLDVEDIIGDAQVWIQDGELHAYIYFADDDPKADHAYAVSDNASYSIGSEWYPEGYFGAGLEIEEPVGILREISMVSTGNDPRAKTIDSKQKDEADGVDMAAKSDDGGTKQFNSKGNEMTKKLDELTQDEGRAMAERILNVVEEFTTDAPESETEPTRRESKDEVEEAPAEEPAKEEAPAEEKKDSLHMPVVIIKDKVAKQEKTADAVKADWRLTNDARQTFSRLAGQFKKFDGNFTAAWQNELKAHRATTNDGITGLALPVDTRQILIDAVKAGEDDSVRILNWCQQVGGKSLAVKLIETAGEANAEGSRAHGHKKGDTKIFQELAASNRTIYNKMIYKMLDLDALEVYENPELIEFRSRELIRMLLAEYARSIVIGDGRSAPAEGQPDYRTFDGTRGFYSILGDATAAEGIGTELATSITVAAGKNLYDASIEVTGAIDAPGALMYIAKKSVVTSYRQATKLNGDYVVAPGASIEASLGAAEVVTPKWMDYADVDVIVVARNAYKLIGDANATMRPEFNVMTNQNILLAEAPRGGSLGERNSAVAVTFATSE
ncbi:hypothetical protein IJH02_03190 [Candidatus Saccharibacteria bacterium]|nr:hypothetical protein [Candidatus Saccharibacteria bacterium]